MTLLRSSTLSRWPADRWVAPALASCALIASGLLAFVIFFLIRESLPVFANTSIDHFLFDDGWYPLENRYGMLPMVWASLACSFGAILLAAPLGIVLGVFQVFYAPKALAKAQKLLIALLAGIPSVVFGLWGLTVIVPIIAAWQPPGTSLFAAIIVLALMILPTVALTCVSALEAVPKHWLNAALALGMTRKGQVLGVALPAAKNGIISGVLLAVARALGETMAVLMVAGNVVQTPHSLFDSVRVLTANIALEMAYATGAHRSALFVSGLLLACLVLLLAGYSARQHKKNAYA